VDIFGKQQDRSMGFAAGESSHGMPHFEADLVVLGPSVAMVW
jgi:hypothetical protein